MRIRVDIKSISSLESLEQILPLSTKTTGDIKSNHLFGKAKVAVRKHNYLISNPYEFCPLLPFIFVRQTDDTCSMLSTRHRMCIHFLFWDVSNLLWAGRKSPSSYHASSASTPSFYPWASTFSSPRHISARHCRYLRQTRFTRGHAPARTCRLSSICHWCYYCMPRLQCCTHQQFYLI